VGNGARERRLLWIALSLVAILALGHYRVCLLGRTPVLRDTLRFSLPSREYLGRSLASGRIPQWCDGVAFGVPFAADPVHGVTYPLAALFAAFPSAFGLDLFTMLHLLIAAVGTAALARRFGAGVAGSIVAGGALGMSGYLSSTLANGMAPLIAWAPWIGWAADRFGQASTNRRREGSVLAMFLALQILPGEPTSILIGFLLAFFFVLARAPRARRAVGRLVLAGVAALPLAAVAIIPGMLLLGTSARQAGLASAVDKWPMYPARMVEWVWPLAFGSERHDGFFAGLLLARLPGDACWAESVFLGLPVLILAVTAAAERSTRKLLLLSLLFVVLALGSFTPILGLLRTVVPPLRLCYFPEKWIYGAIVVWSVLAGVGFTRLVERRPSKRLLTTALVGAALLGLGYVIFLLGAPAFADMLAARAKAWQVPVDLVSGVEASRRGGLLAFLGSLAFVAAVALGRLGANRRWVAGLAAASILVPLVVTNWAATPLARRSTIASVPRILQALERPEFDHGAPLPRIYRPDLGRYGGAQAGGEEMALALHETINTNIGARFGANMVAGMEPAESARVLRFWDEVFPRMSPAAFAGLIGVDAIMIQDPGQIAQMWPTLAEVPGGWSLLRPAVVRPRAFVTPRWFAANADEALSKLGAPERLQDLALVSIENPEPALRPGDGPLSPCRVQRINPERVILDADSPAGGYAVLLDEAARGWTATVDGVPAPIVVADGLFRAVAVRAGAHRIEFRYATPGLRLGALVSLAAWLTCGLVLFWRKETPWQLRRGTARR
jgi:hypothetical protein